MSTGTHFESLFGPARYQAIFPPNEVVYSNYFGCAFAVNAAYHQAKGSSLPIPLAARQIPSIQSSKFQPKKETHSLFYMIEGIDFYSLKYLDAGSEAQVYIAERYFLEEHRMKKVVLKVYEKAHENMRETNALLALNKKGVKHIPQIIDYFRHAKLFQGRYVVVMPHYGTCLYFITQKLDLFNKIKITEIKKIAFQILTTLAQLVQVSPTSTHGDLSDNNVLIDESKGFETTITDWTNGLIQEGNYFTAAIYIRSPEQLLGVKQLAPKMDIWAAGCIFFILATGGLPFLGENTREIVSAMMSELGPPSKQFVDNCPYRTTYFDSNGNWKTDYFMSRGAVKLAAKQELIASKGATIDMADSFYDLLSKMVCWENRITAQQALQHRFFRV